MTSPLARLLVLAAAGFSSFAVTLSSQPAWAAGQGASVTTAGGITTVMLVATIISQFLVPALLRRLSTPLVIALGSALLGMPALLLLVTSTPAAMYAVAIPRGVGFGLFTVAAAMRTVEVAPAGGHGRVAGWFGLSAGIPSLVFVPLGVTLLRWGVWPVVIIAVACLATLPLARGEGRPAAHAVQPVHLPRALRAAGPPSTVLAALTTLSGLTMTILPIVRPTGWIAGVGLVVLGLGSLITRWGSGMLADRVGTVMPSMAACVVGAAGVALLGVGLSGGPDVTTLIACLLIGVAYGCAQTVTMVAAFARAAPDDKPMVSAVWNAAFDAGTALGAVLIGVLLGLLGAPTAYWVLAGLVLLVTPLGRRR